MRILIAAIVILVSFSSCEKLFFDKDKSSIDPFENFNYLWNECDKKYSYFDLKGIDWDQVKSNYESKLYEGMTEDSLFNVLGAMLTELRDDHTNLITQFNVSSFGVEYLGQDNFDWRIIVDNYIGEDFLSSGPFNHNFISNNEIGYIRLELFTGDVGPSNLDYILEKYKDTKGLIIDLRENRGGRIADVFRLLSRFVSSETLVNYSRIKSGAGHNDFSEAVPVYVSPYDGLRYEKNVAILTDRGTYSSGSFTALASKAIPNLMLIGDTTGGGLGIPNGGQLPNGWTYRFSISQALTLDMSPDYENGVPPDINALFDWSDLTKDEVIERAILELL